MAREQVGKPKDPNAVPIDYEESEVIRSEKTERTSSVMPGTLQNHSGVANNGNLLPLPSELNDETWSQEVLLLALELAGEKEEKSHRIPE